MEVSIQTRKPESDSHLNRGLPKFQRFSAVTAYSRSSTPLPLCQDQHVFWRTVRFAPESVLRDKLD